MRRAPALIVVFFAFLISYCLTSPSYIGDTALYAVSVLERAQGPAEGFWEFGHLLWRPWGYAGYSLLGSWYAQLFGDTPAQAAIRFLIQTNFVSSVIVLALLVVLLRKVSGAWITGLVVFALSCSTSFLNYCHSGSPYIPALVFSTAAVLLLIAAAEHPANGHWYAIPAGGSFAIAVALWFPYAFTGVGMLATVCFWPWPRDPDGIRVEPSRLRLAGTFLASLALSALLLFSIGALGEGITSLSGLMQWILQSDHGWSQSNNAMRAITGLPRAVWDFAGDTVILKRWLFSDPYNTSHISSVAFSIGWKLAAFYLGVGATLLVLWWERRAILLILLAAGLPLLLFAVTLFEPSSPERFMPLFPFIYLAFALVLEKAKRYTIASVCIVALLAGTTLSNLWVNGTLESGSDFVNARSRIQALNQTVRPGSLVVVMTFGDNIYSLPGAHPLDNSLGRRSFRVMDAVVVAKKDASLWRKTVADRAQLHWAQQQEVWFSERLVAAAPKAQWGWVEGDDKRLRWRDLASGFGQLETDLKVEADGDGFLRVPQTPKNLALVAAWSAETAAPATTR